MLDNHCLSPNEVIACGFYPSGEFYIAAGSQRKVEAIELVVDLPRHEPVRRNAAVLDIGPSKIAVPHLVKRDETLIRCKKDDEARNNTNIRIAIKCCDRRCQPRRLGPAISVRESSQFCMCGEDAGVSRAVRIWFAMCHCHNRQPKCRELGEQFLNSPIGATVRRSIVVDNDDVEVPIGLFGETCQAFTKLHVHPGGRDKDRDSRGLHIRNGLIGEPHCPMRRQQSRAASNALMKARDFFSKHPGMLGPTR
jgi:hypothetical protein